jgi:transposase
VASPYSNDLRRKLLTAHQRGEGSLCQLAKRFDVSQGWAKKISAALRATGQVERTPGGLRGRTSKLTPAVRQDLRSWIGEQADLTLAELRDRLYRQQQIQVGSTQLWTVLKAMGVRLKKVAPRLRARHGGRSARTQYLAVRNEPDQSIEANFPRRKRGDHGDDAPLWPGL